MLYGHHTILTPAVEDKLKGVTIENNEQIHRNENDLGVQISLDNLVSFGQ